LHIESGDLCDYHLNRGWDQSFKSLRCGQNGCYVVASSPALRFRSRAYDVEAVDTTAAGDAFNGVFATALLQGLCEGPKGSLLPRTRFTYRVELRLTLMAESKLKSGTWSGPHHRRLDLYCYSAVVAR
jgi:hypothetical protein